MLIGTLSITINRHTGEVVKREVTDLRETDRTIEEYLAPAAEYANYLIDKYKEKGA